MSLRPLVAAALLGVLALTGCAIVTPGDVRAARRIVGAKDGGRFSTDDHDDSFTEVVSG